MSDSPAPPARTFTLRDLLVGIAVVAILMGLWVAYLNAQRQERIRHSLGGCRNTMKQLALALQNHNDTYKTFPPLYFSNAPALKANPPLSPLDAAGTYPWQVRLLPFLEEDLLYKDISRNSQTFTQHSTTVKIRGPGNQNISPRDMPLRYPFTCFSIPDDAPDGNCNYAALSATRLPLLLETITREDGKVAYHRPPEGMIVPDRQMRGQSMARMADGTSRTAVLIESREVKRSFWYDPQQSFVVGFLPADSTPIDSTASNYYPYFNTRTEPPTEPTAAHWQFNPAAGNRTALNFGPTGAQPNAAYHGVPGDPLERTWGPSSAHGGGIIMVGMGDGSVMELKDDIDPKVFFALITARGGEPQILPAD